jgi:hypothetical protein
MPQNSIVLMAFSIPPQNYTVGETFVPPEDYPDELRVDLWLRGWISKPDVRSLNADMQEKLSWPEWVENRRRQITQCQGCC